MQHKMPIGMYFNVRIQAHAYTCGVGYSVVCSEVKAMLEPR